MKVLYLNKTQYSNLNQINTCMEVWTDVRKNMHETDKL